MYEGSIWTIQGTKPKIKAGKEYKGGENWSQTIIIHVVLIDCLFTYLIDIYPNGKLARLLPYLTVYQRNMTGAL